MQVAEAVNIKTQLLVPALNVPDEQVGAASHFPSVAEYVDPLGQTYAASQRLSASFKEVLAGQFASWFKVSTQLLVPGLNMPDAQVGVASHFPSDGEYVDPEEQA